MAAPKKSFCNSAIRAPNRLPTRPPKLPAARGRASHSALPFLRFPQMRYIEPHGHMVSRTTDDYARMVTAGCEAVCEPAFWAGFDRGSVEGFHDYFCQLTQHEPKRAA